MLVQEKLNTLLNAKDRDGRKLIYKPEDGGRIYLEIDGEVRCLGFILLGENKILYTKFDDERNIFQKTNSWSINHTILSNVDTVHYETRTHDYLISRERALEFGEFLHFQDTTELKVYVPLIYWEVWHKGLESVFPDKAKWYKRVGVSWYTKLEKTFTSPLIQSISNYIRARRTKAIVYPASDRVFRAFRLCTFEHTKVVFLGQDPYHDGTADGLAFSYLHGAKKSHEKSLDVIFDEVERSVYNGLHLDHDFNLDHWALQGVLLLNAALTVEKGRPLSHSISEQLPEGIGWERFTKIVLLELMLDTAPKVFIIWGTPAKNIYTQVYEVWKKKTMFLSFPHLYLSARHPAYDLRAKKGNPEFKPDYPNTFSGCNHFALANKFLKDNNRKEIKW